MPALSIMLKPASSMCNLRCKYCFYHDISDNREIFSYGMMSDNTAKSVIEKALKLADGDNLYFTFQGGEPTLIGLDFFKKFVSTVKMLNNRNSQVFYALQTNGTLIDEQWAGFFKANGFLIGLSLDGDCQDNSLRVDSDENNCFPSVMRTIEIFLRYEIEFNILTVATARTGENIERIYNWFKMQGLKYLQFVPCLRPFGDNSESELYMSVRQYGDYLVRLFDLYTNDYLKGEYVSVRQFDNIIRMYLGGKPEQCGVSGQCSPQFVVESDGSVFPCDFYCVDEWLLGNINKIGFDAMAQSDLAFKFIRESFDIKSECRSCHYFALCRGGGCKRNRVGIDYCEAYKKFFDTCLPQFKAFIN